MLTKRKIFAALCATAGSGGAKKPASLADILWWGIGVEDCLTYSDVFTATEPTGGWLRTFNPNTDTVGNFLDFVATLGNDYGDGLSYTVTEPTSGWLRVFDPNTATNEEAFSVASTFANELKGTSNAYTITAPTSLVYTFDPTTDDIFDAKDYLATMIITAQSDGVVG